MVWMQRILDRAFDRLVVFRERSIGEHSNGGEEPAYALWIHDERPHVIFGRGVRFEVRHIIACAFSRRFVPPHLFPLRIPRVPIWVAGCAVIEHAAVRWPRP